MPTEDGPPARLVHKGDCGGRVNDRRICERCGKELEVREARAIVSPALEKQLESIGAA